VRIAFVSPVEPGQPGNGSAHRADLWRRSLATVGELTTIVVPVLGDPPTQDAHRGLGEMLVVPTMLLDHADFPLHARKAPEYLGTRLADELEEFDLIVAFKSYMGPFAAGLGSPGATPIIIDLDDDDIAFYASRGQHVEADQHRQLRESIRSRARVMCSAQGFGDTQAIPNAYPIEVPLPSSMVIDRPTDRVVMFANLTYGPNVDGAEWLVDEVWPEVLRRRPDTELIIAGRGSEQVAYGVGFVDDMTPLYRAAAVTVAPILSGSGTRIKILESWAQCVPVVSTPIGIEGLGAVHLEHALITPDPITFAEHIITLLDDGDIARTIAAQARELVEQRFAPDVVAHRIHRLVRSVMSPRVGPVHLHRLSATEVADGMVVDDQESNTVHHLDPVASIVYALSDGRRTTAEIASDIAEALVTPFDRGERLTFIALDQLLKAGLVLDDPSFETVVSSDGLRRMRIRPGTIDHAVFDSVYSMNEYDVPSVLAGGTIVIDIGGHIGSFTARMLDAGVVHAVVVEPQPDNVRMASINLAAAIEDGRVQLHHAAVSGSASREGAIVGVAPMHESAPVINTGGHQCREVPSSIPVIAGEVVVTTMTLDDLISGLRRDVSSSAPIWLKLDCEGGEWAALETSARLGDVETITAEIHLSSERNATRLAALCERLEAIGFAVALDGDSNQATLVMLRARRR
jgi:FkbM family methyltransferase